MKKCAVQWFGAHPEDGSLSMKIFQERLFWELRSEDPFRVYSWPPLQSDPMIGPVRRIRRAVGRYLMYPARVRMLEVSPRSMQIVHVLDHSSGFLLRHIPAGMKRVVTLHDLIPLRFPGRLRHSQVERFRRTVENLKLADLIVAVSNHTKQEAIDLLKIPEERIVVSFPGGNDPKRSSKLDRGASLNIVAELRAKGREIILLSVGSTLERKNLQILPAVVAEVQSKTGRPVSLIRVGQRLPAELRSHFGADQLMEVGHLSDSELRRTMRSVDVVVVPSLYEGFGLPVAEALAEGTSVACSNCTSLPEVAGPCGELFAPRDPVSAASAIIRCLHKDAKFGQDARDQRVAQANQFTWRKHLESLFVGYERVVNK